jgi:phage terminase large subunit-like protein
VAESFGDAREVMIDGISGIMGVARAERPTFEATRRRLVWPSGAVAQMFSSEDPESLRGPQFDLAWCDELGKWRHSRETWDMLQFALRLGPAPAAAGDDDAAGDALDAGAGEGCGHAGDADPHRGQCGEPGGGVSGDHPGALRRHPAGKAGTRRRADRRPRGRAVAARQIEALVVRSHGPLHRIVVAVDPPASGEARHSCCGIVAVGLDAEGRAVVLADGSVEGASPTRWAGRWRGSTAASTPIAWWPRSTRAATW